MDESIQDTYINIIENITCNICYNNYFNNEIVNTNCNHTFCEDCLLTWFERKKICPECDFSVE